MKGIIESTQADSWVVYATLESFIGTEEQSALTRNLAVKLDGGCEVDMVIPESIAANLNLRDQHLEVPLLNVALLLFI